MSTAVSYLQQNALANGNGTSLQVQGTDSAIQIEIVETAGGTATVTFEGSFDAGANWYAVGYQQIDNTASPSRAVAGVSVTANSAHVYQILDPYPQMRARISSYAGAANVTVRAYTVQ